MKVQTNFECVSLSYSRGQTAMNGAGLGIDRPAELTKSDDEYDAFRKRMMLAYRFRPNPLVTYYIYSIISYRNLTLVSSSTYCAADFTQYGQVSFAIISNFNQVFLFSLHRIIHGDHITDVGDCFCLFLVLLIIT